MSLSARLDALEGRAGMTGAGAELPPPIADPCPGCCAAVREFYPFTEAPPDAGLARCGACKRVFVTAAGLDWARAETARDPDGPLARSGGDGEALRRVLGVPHLEGPRARPQCPDCGAREVAGPPWTRTVYIELDGIEREAGPADQCRNPIHPVTRYDLRKAFRRRAP